MCTITLPHMHTHTTYMSHEPSQTHMHMHTYTCTRTLPHMHTQTYKAKGLFFGLCILTHTNIHTHTHVHNRTQTHEHTNIHESCTHHHTVQCTHNRTGQKDSSSAFTCTHTKTHRCTATPPHMHTQSYRAEGLFFSHLRHKMQWGIPSPPLYNRRGGLDKPQP